MKELYGLLRKANHLGWRSRLTKKSEIRMYPPNSGTCHCPLTAAYRVKCGVYVRVHNAGITRHALGLDQQMDPIERLSTVVMYAADRRVRKLQEFTRTIGDPGIRIRRTMFRILGLDPAQL